MQKHVNLVDLVKSFPTNIYLQNVASIQKRTSPLKFAHLAEKSENGSISNLSTKVRTARESGDDTTRTSARSTPRRSSSTCRACRPRRFATRPSACAQPSAVSPASRMSGSSPHSDSQSPWTWRLYSDWPWRMKMTRRTIRKPPRKRAALEPNPKGSETLRGEFRADLSLRKEPSS